MHTFIHITPKQSKYIYDIPLIVRHSGIAVSGFSYLSFKMSCLFVVCLIYVAFKKPIFNLIHGTFIILALALIFVARTGLFIVIVSYIVFLIYTNKKLLTYFVLLIFSISSFFVISLEEQNKDLILSAFNRSFDLFLNDEQDKSLEVLNNDANNTKVNNILLGDGDYGRLRGLITDIGYLSFLKGGGLFGLFFLTAHWFYLIAVSLKKITLKKSRLWIQYSLFIIVILHLIFNFKELVFYSHGYIQTIIILLILYKFK